ncbi:hypothetical protein D3C76_427690 [compost metagenome]
MDVLGEEIQLEVAAELGARAAIADPVQNDLLGGIERSNHTAILLGQFQAPGFDIELADRLEQLGLELEVIAQLAVQGGQALLHRLVGKQHLPQHRQRAIPGCAGHQQDGLVPEITDFTAALVHADHGVDRQNQGGRGDGTIALAQSAEHGQAEAGQCQGADKHNRVGEQQLHRKRRDTETHQGHCQCIEPALPAVVCFSQGAGNDAEKQRNQQRHLVLEPAQRHAAGQGDEYPYAVTELVQRPQAPQGLAKRSR